jgi:hypothetical protein
MAAGSSMPRRPKRRRRRLLPRSSLLFTAATEQPKGRRRLVPCLPLQAAQEKRQAQGSRQAFDLRIHQAEQLAAAHVIRNITGSGAFRHERLRALSPLRLRFSGQAQGNRV